LYSPREIYKKFGLRKCNLAGLLAKYLDTKKINYIVNEDWFTLPKNANAKNEGRIMTWILWPQTIQQR
jgi:hypothetical protein